MAGHYLYTIEISVRFRSWVLAPWQKPRLAICEGLCYNGANRLQIGVDMERKKRSPIWLISKEQLQGIVRQSVTLSEILIKFGLINKGSNYRTLKNRLAKDGIDFSHIPLGQNSNKGRPLGGRRPIPIEELLIVGSTSARTSLKKRLIAEGIMENRCAICGLFPVWNEKPLVLVLDHINGISDDYRRENIRLLCPNCNSQTDTFAGRNRGESKLPAPIEITEVAAAWIHDPKPEIRVVERPDRETLRSMIIKIPMTRIGKMYGVTSGAVKRWAKSYGLVIKRDIDYRHPAVEDAK
jgi:hypothetical protein